MGSRVGVHSMQIAQSTPSHQAAWRKKIGVANTLAVRRPRYNPEHDKNRFRVCASFWHTERTCFLSIKHDEAHWRMTNQTTLWNKVQSLDGPNCPSGWSPWSAPAKGLTPSKQEATCKRQDVTDMAISERSMTVLQIFIFGKYEIDLNRMVRTCCIASWRSIMFPILSRRIAATLETDNWLHVATDMFDNMNPSGLDGRVDWGLSRGQMTLMGSLYCTTQWAPNSLCVASRPQVGHWYGKAIHHWQALAEANDKIILCQQR